MAEETQTVEEEATTYEPAIATEMGVPIITITEEGMLLNKTAHVQVLENTVGPTGGAPTVVLSVRAK